MIDWWILFRCIKISKVNIVSFLEDNLTKFFNAEYGPLTLFSRCQCLVAVVIKLYSVKITGEDRRRVKS